MSRIVSELIYKLVADNKELTASLAKSEKDVERLAKSFDTAGKALSKGLTVPLVAAGVGMLKLASDAGNAADRLLDLEQITGLSTDTLQEFKNVAVVAGVDFESLVGSLTKFTARLDSIESEGGPAADAVKSLGVAIRDANGNVRSADELFPEFLDKLNRVENITERNALAQNIFGKSLEALAPVLSLTADQIEAARKEAHALGVVQSKDALNAANNYRIELEKLKLSIQGQVQAIGQELVPVMQSLLPIVGDAARSVAGLLRSFSGLPIETQKTVFAVGAFLAALGPTLIAVGGLTKLVGGATLAVKALTVALAANPLVIAGIAVAAGIGLVAKALSDIKKTGDEIQEARTFDISDSIEENRKKMEALRVETQAAFDRVKEVPQNLKASFREQAQELAATYREFEKQLAAQEEQERLASLYRQRTEEITKAEQARTLELQKQKVLQDEIQKKVEQRYLDARGKVLQILDAEKTEYQLIQEEIDALQKTPWASGKLEDDRLRAIEILRGRQQAIIDQELQAAYSAAEANEAKERQRLDDIAKRKKAEEDAAAAELAAIERAKQAYKEAFLERLSLTQGLVSKFFNIGREIYANEKQDAENRYALEKERIEREIVDEEEKKIALEKLEKERAEQALNIKQKEAIANKAVALFDIAINTASAIVKSLPNVFLAATVGALGAAQAAVVSTRPIPKFAEGVQDYVVPPGFPNDSFPILVQSGESVTVKTPEQRASSQKSVNVPVYFSAPGFKESLLGVIQVALKDGELVVDARNATNLGAAIRSVL